MKGLTPHLTFMSLICQCNQVRVPHLLSPRGKSAVAIDQSESMIAASVSAPSLLPRSCHHLYQWFPPSSLEENPRTIQPTTNALLYARVLQCLKAYFCSSPGSNSCSGWFLWITYLCLGLWTLEFRFFCHFFYHILANLWLANWTVGGNWSTWWKTPTNPKSLATFSHAPAEDFCGLLTYALDLWLWICTGMNKWWCFCMNIWCFQHANTTAPGDNREIQFCDFKFMDLPIFFSVFTGGSF